VKRLDTGANVAPEGDLATTFLSWADDFKFDTVLSSPSLTRSVPSALPQITEVSMARFTRQLHVRSFVIALSALIVPGLGTQTKGPLFAQQGSRGTGDDDRADPCGHLQPLPAHAQAGDRPCPSLGNSGGVAKGDFNGDNVGDLAVGVPDESVVATRVVNGTSTQVNIARAGAVVIIYGSANDGLSASGGVLPSQLIHQEVTGVLDSVETDDRFGAALASGDFNGDTFSDLAISVPGDNAVQIIEGGPTGLDLTDNRLILGTDFVDDQGLALTLKPGLVWGNFNGDDFGDLAIEATEPHAIGLRANVIVLYGSQQFGLQFVGLDVFSFNNAGIGGDNIFAAVEMSLAAGDFSGDGADDLAVGLPLADVVTQAGLSVIDGGTVTILQGLLGTVPNGGLSTAGATGLTELSAGAVPQISEQFGTTLAAGDFDGDLAADLAVGTPKEDVVGTTGSFVTDGGFVAVFSHATTLHGVYTQLPLGQTPQNSDVFGSALTAGDFNGDGAKDLVIGAPGDSINGVAGAGSVTVLYGIVNVGLPRPASAGLPQINGTVQLFTQESTNIVDAAEAGDHFGAVLTAWNFGKSAQADLAIGVPEEDVVVSVVGLTRPQTRADAGAVHVLYGAAGGLQSTGSQFWTQNSVGVPDSVESGDRFGAALY